MPKALKSPYRDSNNLLTLVFNLSIYMKNLRFFVGFPILNDNRVNNK